MGAGTAPEAEIELPPEAIEAGASVLLAAVDGCSSLEGISLRAQEIAEEVFRAIYRASGGLACRKSDLETDRCS